GVVCVGLGPRLAERARARLRDHPRVRVVTAPFERWDPGGERFDLVLAATSWHWLDPDLRFERAAAALGRGGALAIVTTKHVLPPDGDPFFAEIQDVYAAIGEGDAPPPQPAAV